MFDFLAAFTITTVNLYLWLLILTKLESRRDNRLKSEMMHDFLMSEVLKPRTKKVSKKDKSIN